MSISSYGRDVVLALRSRRFVADRYQCDIGQQHASTTSLFRETKQQAVCHLVKLLISCLFRIYARQNRALCRTGCRNPNILLPYQPMACRKDPHSQCWSVGVARYAVTIMDQETRHTAARKLKASRILRALPSSRGMVLVQAKIS